MAMTSTARRIWSGDLWRNITIFPCHVIFEEENHLVSLLSLCSLFNILYEALVAKRRTSLSRDGLTNRHDTTSLFSLAIGTVWRSLAALACLDLIARR